MNVAVYSTKPYDRRFLEEANAGHHSLVFLEDHLNAESAPFFQGNEAACLFVNDRATAPVLQKLASRGCRLIALRCAGYNNVDLKAAQACGITVVRVPAYSPHGVAEHAAALILCLNRKLHRAYNRVREGNFSIDGLMGFDLHGKTVGVIGTGKIGRCFAGIMRGFGCRLLGYDVEPSEDFKALGDYAPLPRVLADSDIVSLHCPLLPQTRHLIRAESLARMKPGAMLINTGRGGLVDTPAVLEVLKSGHLGALALDVYEEEEKYFFEDLSGQGIDDDVLARLTTYPNVLITSHQAFFTHEAMRRISTTTIQNITEFAGTGTCPNSIQS
ncbi:MAG: 2-hydroxyacid dehydrogenase [Verrucomicrobiae bacterium]|nr:2-hydroxyacid dehydrogenase [Verrucomicrobiae bacterium]